MKTDSSELDRYAELQTIGFDSARNGDSLTLEKMIVAGMPVDLQDEKGNSFLMLAAYNGQLETVERLIVRGANVDLRNHRNQTPLAGVAFKGDLAMARLLVKNGANVEADQGGGQTPLQFALMFGRDDVANYLRQVGANPERRGRWGIRVKYWSLVGICFQKIANLLSDKGSGLSRTPTAG